MHRGVPERWHRAVLDCSHYPLRSLRMLIPLRKVKRVAPAVDVGLGEPGYRGDICIPAPGSLIAVAVVAGSNGELASLRAIPVRLLHDSRVLMSMTEGNELDRDKESDQRNAQANEMDAPKLTQTKR